MSSLGYVCTVMFTACSLSSGRGVLINLLIQKKRFGLKHFGSVQNGNSSVRFSCKIFIILHLQVCIKGQQSFIYKRVSGELCCAE